jgi:phenylacetic acid degradation protein paaN
MSHPLFDKHRPLLDRALAAIAERGYWSAYPESPSPKVYGEKAAEEGKAAFDARLGKTFEMGLPGVVGRTGAEVSPYGFPLGIEYPKVDVDALIAGVEKARQAWRRAGPEAWVGVCLEIIDRINKASFEIANAVMHTTGQAFVMAFQAAGPHAQDRALEAVAYAWDEMRRVPPTAYWEKPQGRNEPLRMEKRYTIVPRGVGLVIGCCTFPTWNGYPGLFASLATGNAVIVKPHPAAILPLAISVDIARRALAEAGFDANVVTLVAHGVGEPVAQALAMRPEIGIIDFTGSSANGEWLEKNARHAQVFTEKAGVNAIVIESTDDFKGMVRNIAFSLSLYTGQMCTAPQNLYVPSTGIDTPEGHLTFDQVAAAIGEGVAKFLADPARAVEVLGAVQGEATIGRIEQARGLGEVVLDSKAIAHPQFPNARTRTPLILKTAAANSERFLQELFGPISFVIATDGVEQALSLVREGGRRKGALTLSVYSTRPDVLERAREVAEDVGVSLSCNLTGGVFVNQSAAFSDYHGTGANPAANASLTDSAFVASRFRVVQSRRHVPAPAPAAPATTAAD